MSESSSERAPLLNTKCLFSGWRSNRTKVEIPLFLFIVTSMIHRSIYQAFLFHKSCLYVFGSNGTVSKNATLICADNANVHDNIDVQTLANHLSSLFNAAHILLGVPVTLILGAFADRNHRKVALLIPLVGALLANINDVTQSLCGTLNPYWLGLSDVFFGLCGGFVGLFAAAFSMAASEAAQCEADDVSTEQQDQYDHIPVLPNRQDFRSRRMAGMETAIGVGSAIGYLTAAMLNASGQSYATMFSVELILRVLAALFVMICIGEIRSTVSDGTTLDCKKVLLAPCQKVWESLTTVFKYRALKSRRILLLTLLALFMDFITFMGFGSIMYFYLVLKLKWSTTLYSAYLVTSSCVNSVGVFLLYPKLKLLGASDSTLALFGVGSRILTATAFSIPISTPFLLSASIFSIGDRFAAASLRSILSKQVEINEQGHLFAFVALLEGVASLVASTLFNSLLPATLRVFDAFCFILMTCFQIVPLLVIFSVRKILKEKESVLLEQ